MSTPSSAKKKKAVRVLADFFRRLVLAGILPDGPEQEYHKALLHKTVAIIKKEHGNLNGLFDFLMEAYPDKKVLTPELWTKNIGIDPEFLTDL